MHYFSIVFSQFNKAWGQFLRVWRKNAIFRKFLRKFSKIFKKIIKKIANKHYFSRFFRKFKKLCVNFFARLDEKDNLLEIFENFLQKIT